MSIILIATRTKIPFLSSLLLSSLLLLAGCSTTPQKQPPSQTQQTTSPEEPLDQVYTSQQLEAKRQQALKAQDYAQFAYWSKQLWLYTKDPEKQNHIQIQTWQIFQSLPLEQLNLLEQQLAQQTHHDKTLLSWIHLSQAWQSHQGLNRLSALKNEMELIDTPDFFQPILQQAQHSLRPLEIQKLAIFLPLTGKYQQISQQIRNGLIKNSLLKHPNITLSFYDTEENPDLVALYQQAMADGNDWVIGPLKKQNIRQLQTLNVENITALNQLDQSLPFIQFSFRTASEAQQIETKLCQTQYRHLGILTSQTPGDLKLAQTLAYRWQQMPLHHATLNSYSTRRPNLRKALGNLINETQSQDRKANLRWLLQKKLHFFPRTRQDLEAIIIIGNRSRVAVFKPQFKFFNLKLPIYGSSKLTPKNLHQAHPIKDLYKVIFPTFPAALHPNPPQTHLEAFGWDSLELTLNAALLAPNLCLNTGLTGTLTLPKNKKADRQLHWAIYTATGHIQPLNDN